MIYISKLHVYLMNDLDKTVVSDRIQMICLAPNFSYPQNQLVDTTLNFCWLLLCPRAYQLKLTIYRWGFRPKL